MHPHFLQGPPGGEQQQVEDSPLGLLPDLTRGVRTVSDALATVLRLMQAFPSLEGEEEQGRGGGADGNKG